MQKIALVLMMMAQSWQVLGMEIEVHAWKKMSFANRLVEGEWCEDTYAYVVSEDTMSTLRNEFPDRDFWANEYTTWGRVLSFFHHHYKLVTQEENEELLTGELKWEVLDSHRAKESEDVREEMKPVPVEEVASTAVQVAQPSESASSNPIKKLPPTAPFKGEIHAGQGFGPGRYRYSKKKNLIDIDPNSKTYQQIIKHFVD